MRCFAIAQHDSYHVSALKVIGISQEIRQILYDRGRNLYRIIFTILEEQDFPTVRVLHIRHAAQQTLGAVPDSSDS